MPWFLNKEQGTKHRLSGAYAEYLLDGGDSNIVEIKDPTILEAEGYEVIDEENDNTVDTGGGSEQHTGEPEDTNGDANIPDNTEAQEEPTEEQDIQVDEYDNLDDMVGEDLKELSKILDIKGRSKMNNDQLREAIKSVRK